MWETVSAIVRVILVMSVSGSVITLVLFALKPFIKKRISKAAQYYLWIIAVFAFLIPLFILITLPVSTPVTRLQYVIEEYVKSNAEWQEQVAQELYGVPYEELDVMEQVDITYRELKTRKIGDYGMFSLNLLLFGTAFFLKELVLYVGYIAKLRRGRLPARERELSFLPENSPRLYRSPLAATPMLVGIFNSSIYLPDVEYTDEQLGNILRHELTHWRRRDVALKWLATLAVQIHWFNPIAYFMRREFDRACELACDEAVIRNLDAAGKQSYGDTLIDVAADVKKSKMIVSVTMCEEKKKLKERLVAIMNFRKKTKLAVLITAVLAVALTGSAFAFGAQGELEIGVSANNIEQDARRSQSVRELEVAKAINDNLCAMVFYNDAQDKHTFSIYVKGDGLRLGYFFRIGGSSSEIAEDYREFTFEDKGSAILSMNRNGYRQIQYDNGAGVTTIDIDPAKPFAVVLPEDCFMVTLFKDNGNIVVRDS